MWTSIAPLVLLGANVVVALGEPRVITFPTLPPPLDGSSTQAAFSANHQHHQSGNFVIASKHHRYAAPLLLDSHDNVAIHIAAQTFADDVHKVTGVRPELYNDTLPRSVRDAIVVGSVESDLIGKLKGVNFDSELKGKWESYEIRPKANVIEGVDEALVVVGSDRRGTIFALYTLSEQMGVSPWHFWSDVPVRPQAAIGFNRSTTLAHGEPTVKYRGIFINDEHPALWGWAQEYFKRQPWEAAFQTDFYKPWFEMMLRLKSNYHWPAMWISMFGVDGLPGIPDKPIPGPNQVLANDMGIVMGLSHHEPMDRTKPEWDHVKVGPWDWTNKDVLLRHWTYGAERAKGREVMFTMGMRGDGDEPLSGASIELVENITAAQKGILQNVYGDASTDLPKLWAMYKEVADYYVDGLEVPDDISILFSDDNWGNLMSVMSPERQHPAGAGMYYHVDYVGLPRAYKWINTINLAKTWEQMNIARAFNTTQIWIVNVGSLKPLEMPTEHFLALAYDFDAWSRTSVRHFLEEWSAREFGEEVKEEVGDILFLYGRYASRSKPELLNSTIWSLMNYNEAERVQEEWDHLAARAKKVHDHLPKETQPAFFQLVYMLCEMQANIQRLYIAVGKSNHYAIQSRNSANHHAHAALTAFKNDAHLTELFHGLNGGRWDHMLDQTHINWGDWLEADQDTLPPVSFINPHQPVLQGIPVKELHIPYAFSARITVENDHGAWPGRSAGNCPALAKCDDPTLFPIDPYGSQTRWIEISAGGPKNFDYKVHTDQPWLKVSERKGRIIRDGSTDQRLFVSVDWKKVDADELGSVDDGHVLIQATDGANVTITVPVVLPKPVAEDFHGHVEGDGYVVIEAAHYSDKKDSGDYSWGEIDGYGRTLSGFEMLPTTPKNFTAGDGPSLVFDIWTHSAGEAEINVQIGPSLNFLTGKQLSFGVQVDDKPAAGINPVPTERLGGVEVKPGKTVFVGAVPVDWENVVKSDVRNVTVPWTFEEAGKHTVTLWGMTAGVVVERIWVDFGGIRERGYSYLGPPESLRV